MKQSLNDDDNASFSEGEDDFYIRENLDDIEQLTESSNRPSEDLYGILGIDKSATESDIKDAYRRLCIQFHPDKQASDGLRDAASSRFQKVQFAYSVLGDTTKRTLYDTYGLDAVDEYSKSAASEMQVGFKLKTPAEIKAEYELIALKQRALKVNSLVKSSGEINMTVDLTESQRMANQKFMQLVKQPDGSFVPQPVDAKDALQSTRAVSITKAFVKHGWKFPVNKSLTGQISGTVIAVGVPFRSKYNAALEVAGGLRKHWNTRLYTDSSVTLGSTPSVSSTAVYTPNERSFVSISTLASWPLSAPLCQVMYGAQLGNAYSGHVFLKGSPLELSLGAAQVGCRVARQLSDNSADTERKVGEASIDIVGGLSSSSLSVTLLRRNVYRDVTAKTSAGISQARGIFTKIYFEKECFAYTRIGFGAELSSAEGVSWLLSLKRLGQKLTVPVLLVPEFDLVKFGIALGLPVGAALLLDRYVWQPRCEKAYGRKLERAVEKYKDILDKSRREALETQQLLLPAAFKKQELERRRSGLVILEAYYGQESFFPNLNLSLVQLPVNYSVELDLKSKLHYIDVALVLQSMVNDGQLCLGRYSKASVMGFFDVAFGREKVLTLSYMYNDKLHFAKFKDKDRIILPLKQHQL